MAVNKQILTLLSNSEINKSELSQLHSLEDLQLIMKEMQIASEQKLLEMRSELQTLIECRTGSSDPADIAEYINAQQKINMDIQRVIQQNKALSIAISNDSFGRCILCDDDINIRRLNSNPTYVNCSDCAEINERRAH